MPGLPRISCGRRSVLAVFFIALLAAVLAPTAYAKLDVSGKPADVAAFNAGLRFCSEASPSFKALVKRAQDSAKRVKIKVARSPDTVLIGSFRAGGPQLIDLDDIGKLPIPRKDPYTGKWTLPQGVNRHAVTACEALAHELAETVHEAETGEGFIKSHDAGLQAQNDVRADFGQNKVVSNTIVGIARV